MTTRAEAEAAAEVLSLARRACVCAEVLSLARRACVCGEAPALARRVGVASAEASASADPVSLQEVRQRTRLSG